MDILILIGVIFLLVGVVIPIIFMIGVIWYKKVVDPIMDWMYDRLDLL